MITKERAIDAVKREQHLAQIFELEPVQMESLIDIVDMYCSNPSERWENYGILKKAVRELVGRDAKRPELRTSAHYEVLLAFIDWLLPESESSL
jgi:hypothetical protein